MTAPRQPDRDTAPVEALVADRYLDALLAGAEGRPGSPDDASLDPDVRGAALVLRRSLVRVHPSFRFEERLARRLAALAAAQASPALASGGGTVVPFRAPADTLDADLDAILRGDLDPAADGPDAPDGPEGDLARLPADRRPLLVTGALTSAAISLAGIAWVAWRASRPASRTASRTGSPMGRAARLAHARRDGVIGGIGGPA